MVIKWFWNLVNFIDGYFITRSIKKNNPELYKVLTEEFSPENFEEVPGRPGLHIHKDALEAMRMLGEEGHA